MTKVKIKILPGSDMLTDCGLFPGMIVTAMKLDEDAYEIPHAVPCPRFRNPLKLMSYGFIEIIEEKSHDTNTISCI